ncbi:O-acetyl-ADP-ribose deacetylase [Candidatus Oleimmundimicrobium sp.]|uniref:O-acetyl-ADP-ribose deacetylase n=1 Tax=Candidatus Oleimmundimicrobium sp. TaxID=3060597 RepID=UPI002724A1B7|nr:O-acetyl-ADP-ribose deacetylase [Candidatus Oleimmundimicrobium sp.]MDO8885996.1 O-acetyl-ADP-ribose deacetylase [Candidatus Oleimmundimicrobium sp.]
MNIKVNKTTLSLIQGDITKQDTEAIVNAANSSLIGGGGVDGAIHKIGGPKILKECKEIIKKIGRLPTGEAVITTGGSLLAKYVIHTVGPIWRGRKNREPELLKDAYTNSLKLAMKKEIKTIAFPSISTGAYRYPLKEAAKIALKTVVDFLKENNKFDEVKFVLFTEETYLVYKETLNLIKG